MLPLGISDAGGFGLTVTTSDVAALQLFVSVTVTVYVPLVFTVMLCVLEELFHRKPTPPFAVRITSSPWQNESGPSAVITAVGLGRIFTLKVMDAEQPSTEKPVTV
jgi:hypothetical protein